jgi:hypothetical protein
MAKQIITPDGRRFCLGRNRPVAPVRPHLKYRALKDAGVLPTVTVPDSTNFSAAAGLSLANIYGNDTLGDCVIAAMLHLRGVSSASATGTPVLFTPAQTIQLYGAIGGYNPADPSTDQGCDENEATAYGVATGFPDGVKWQRVVSVDATDYAEVREAQYLFGLLFGWELPDAYVAKMPQASGFTWDIAGDPDPSNGHGFAGVDLAPNGVVISTWGMTGTVTEDAIAEYGWTANNGQLFAVLSPDSINNATQRSAAGYDPSDLLALLGSIQT